MISPEYDATDDCKEPTQTLRHSIPQIETWLASIYEFDLELSFADFIYSRPQLIAYLGRSIQAQGEWLAPAAIWLCEGNDEMFLGVHVDKDIVSCLDRQPPEQTLDSRNLNAFCVVVEEISHFHLIANRGRQMRKVTRPELELQAEVDKMLVCGIFLKQQYGHPHLQKLFELLFTHAKVVAVTDATRYDEATIIAAQFWRSIIRRYPHILRDPLAVLPMIREFYRATMAEKQSLLMPVAA